MYLLFAMLSLNFFLILNLPHLINQCFHFYELTIFQCPSFFISYIVIAFYAPPLLKKAVISLTEVVYLARGSTSPVCLLDKLRRILLVQRCICFYTLPAFKQISLIRELWDIVPGTPEPTTCSKLKSK